jgi:hypothetical protein
MTAFALGFVCGVLVGVPAFVVFLVWRISTGLW